MTEQASGWNGVVESVSALVCSHAATCDHMKLSASRTDRTLEQTNPDPITRSDHFLTAHVAWPLGAFASIEVEQDDFYNLQLNLEA